MSFKDISVFVGRKGFVGLASVAALSLVATAMGAKKRELVSDVIVSEKDEVELVEDSSVAEAIERRPDLSFSNVTIDGEDSNISLDSISADAVESVEVMKAVTPDQDADSRGGSISLKSRPAYQQKSFSRKFSFETEYESGVEDFGYEGQLSMSGPLNEKRTVGGRLSLRWEENVGGAPFISQDWIQREFEGVDEWVIKELRVYDRTSESTEKEIGGSIDFKLGENLSFFARGNYLEEDDLFKYPHMKYRFNKGDYLSGGRDGASVLGAEIENGFYESETFEDSLETVLGAEWEKGDWIVDMRLTYQRDEFEQGDNLSVDFVASDVAMSYDLADPQFPEIILADDYMSDASLYQFEDYSTRGRVGSETDQIGSVNVKWKNAFGHENALLRFGAKSRVRDRDRGNEVEFWDFGEEGSFTLTEVMADDGYLPFIEGRYATNIQADYASLRDGISQKADLFVYDERRSREQSDSSTNDVEEQVDAFYGMASVEVGKWRGIVGLRSEDTSISFNANEVLIDQDRYDADNDGDVDEFIYLETRPTYGENQYGNSFSNAHLRYRWNERTTVIASYTNTVDRPNYAEVVPYRRVDVEDREIEEGNPELRPTLYTNLDFSVDYKLGEGGMLSFELFDRAVDDVIFSRETVVSGGVYDGFELERRENNASAQIRGLSFTWNQPLYLAMLPGGLSFNANYVRQDTELVYPFRPDEVLPVTGRPDSRLKLALNYQTKKIFAQLKLATSDESIYRVGNSPEKDRFRRPRERMDLSVSYKLQDKTRFYVEWENLTNAPELDNYEGEEWRYAGYRENPWTIATGVKVEL